MTSMRSAPERSASTLLRRTTGLLLCLSLLSASTTPPAVAAASKKQPPSGTLLIPITPKIDTSPPTPAPAQQPAQQKAPQAAQQPAQPAGQEQAAAPAAGDKAAPARTPQSLYAKQYEAQEQALKPAPEQISAEHGNIDPGGESEIGEDTTLKGTIQMVADDTEYDQEKNTFLGTGNAVVLIHGENSKLEADTILYDQNNQTIDARGSVRIYRDGTLTTGSAFKFNVTSNEYLITHPDTEVQGATVIARKGVGSTSGLRFQDGVLTLPKPVTFSNNVMYGPISNAEESMERKIHPEAYVPEKQSFKFKARKMVYERYKEAGNLTVFGGRLMFGKFGVPVPKFEATVGKDDNRVVFPVTPLMGNNLNMGGFSLGASFNRPMGRRGVFSVAPLVQIGGRSLDTTSNNAGRVGVGARIAFVNDKISSHLAYGSVSNLVVGDFKWQVSRTFKVQVGVNRFLDDGLFGTRRARFLAEAVHNKIIGGIPFISMLQFRTSGGMAQDNSALLNLTPQYAELFNQPVVPDKTFALRVQEQISATTHPIFNIGNDKYGAKAFLFGGLALRGYSTGDAMMMGQIGPILNVYLNRVRLQTGYVQSAVRGQSPFTFDQFIQGQRSVSFGGDVKVNKYLTIGGSTGYNLNAKLLYQRSLVAAIGPPDFKVLFSYDTIRRNNRYGFDILYGQPVPFNKLVLKGSPDHGQLGGI